MTTMVRFSVIVNDRGLGASQIDSNSCKATVVLFA